MEWLMNRRRMMFNKSVPPTYLTFEDSRIWTACCNAWGDHNKIVVTDNGNNTVNIVTTFESMSGTTVKKSTIVSTQTDVDNTGGAYIAGTTYEPIGITEKQCTAVTTFGTYLRNLGSNLKFTECRYFRVTNLNNGTPFQNDVFEKIKFPTTVSAISCYSSYYNQCEILDFPPITISSFNAGLTMSNVEILILRNNAVQNANAGYVSRFKSNLKIYVPQEVLDEYKESSIWSARADSIYPIEGSDYEVFNGWEYTD